MRPLSPKEGGFCLSFLFFSQYVDLTDANGQPGSEEVVNDEHAELWVRWVMNRPCPSCSIQQYDQMIFGRCVFFFVASLTLQLDFSPLKRRLDLTGRNSCFQRLRSGFCVSQLLTSANEAAACQDLQKDGKASWNRAVERAGQQSL